MMRYGIANKDFELVEWVGRTRTLYDRGKAIKCQELRFSTAWPFGVVDPPAAASSLSGSLCCVRSALKGEELLALQAQLVAAPVRAPWGDPTDLEMSKSQRSLLYIHTDAAALASMGANGVPPAALNNRNACLLGNIADDIAELLAIQDEPLMALQANYQHTNFPLHYDIPRQDGFGKSIATVRFGRPPHPTWPTAAAHPHPHPPPHHSHTHTHKNTHFAASRIFQVNVRGKGVVIINEDLDPQGRAWCFDLDEGDVYAMLSTGNSSGYVRERCSHGLPSLKKVPSVCLPGCQKPGCRISLNLRYGLHTPEEAARMMSAWP
jgi:hypothetical protein